MAAAASGAWGCTPYDPDRLGFEDGGQGGSGQGGSTAGRGSSGEGGGAGTAMCAPAADELCNRFDDDCDGATDEGARASCEQVILNAAETDCVPFNDTARCVLLRCLPDFANCDGDPTNGCEDAFCACNECDDAGGEDAGTEDAGG